MAPLSAVLALLLVCAQAAEKAAHAPAVVALNAVTLDLNKFGSIISSVDAEQSVPPQLAAEALAAGVSLRAKDGPRQNLAAASILAEAFQTPAVQAALLKQLAAAPEAEAKAAARSLTMIGEWLEENPEARRAFRDRMALTPLQTGDVMATMSAMFDGAKAIRDAEASAVPGAESLHVSSLQPHSGKSTRKRGPPLVERVKTLFRDARATVGASSIKPEVSEGGRAEIDYLNRLGYVRLYFTAAPGFGHQSATLAIARRLRDLGYTGKLDAVYQEQDVRLGDPTHYGTVAQKLEKLLPEFDANGPSQQYIASLDMTIRPKSGLGLLSKKAPVAMTGGADHPESFLKTVKAKLFLRLGPTDWGGYADTVYRNGGRRFTVKRNADKPLLYSPASEPGAGMEVLAGAARRADVLPLYGLVFATPGMIQDLVEAAKEVQTRRPDLLRGKGVVMPFLLNESALWSMVARNYRNDPRVKTASIGDPDLAGVIAALGPEDILLLKTGPVPPSMFEWLFRASTLPPTLEGKNAMTLARMLGIPYIPLKGNSLGDLKNHTHDQDVGAHLDGVVPDQAFGWKADALAAYLIDALTPGSSLRAFFTRAMFRQDDYQNDKLLRAVSVVLQTQ